MAFKKFGKKKPIPADLKSVAKKAMIAQRAQAY